MKGKLALVGLVLGGLLFGGLYHRPEAVKAQPGPYFPTYTANTTLTTTSPTTVACSNNTATITLQNATDVGTGYVQTIVNNAATGNITVASASNISLLQNVTVIQATACQVKSDGTKWWRLY